MISHGFYLKKSKYAEILAILILEVNPIDKAIRFFQNAFGANNK